MSTHEENSEDMSLPSNPQTPIEFNVDERIACLNEYLDPESSRYKPTEHHQNIRAAIKCYEEKTIKDPGYSRTHFKAGKIISAEEATSSADVWTEGVERIYALKELYGSQDSRLGCHYLDMRLRLVQSLGGNGTTHRIKVLNDTGSTILRLFDDDMEKVGLSPEYRGQGLKTIVVYANGTEDSLQSVTVEVQLCYNGGAGWSEWIEEKAVIIPRIERSRHQTGTAPLLGRLSGSAIRNHFYFGTAPGSRGVAVATTPGGLHSLLQPGRG